MYPRVEETCQYKFIDAFSPLDGIYTVKNIASLDEYLEQGVDIATATYAKAGRTEAEYQEEVANFKDEDIYRLVHVETGDSIYVPMSFTAEIPDPNVFAYQEIGIGMNLGAFKDPESIEWVQTLLADRIKATLGVDNVPIVWEVTKTWMTEDEYNLLVADRQTVITQTTNDYTDNVALQKENTRLKTIIQYYEQHIKAQQS